MTIQELYSPHEAMKKRGYDIVGPSSIRADYCLLKNKLDFWKGTTEDNTKANMGHLFHIVAADAMRHKKLGHEPALQRSVKLISDLLDEFESYGVYSQHSNSVSEFAWDEDTYAADCTGRAVKNRSKRVYTAREMWTERLEMGIAAWYKECLPRYEPIDIEVTMLQPNDIEMICLLGTADLIATDNETGKLTVVDWKTGGKSYDDDQAFFKARVLPQLTLYSHLYRLNSDIDFYPAVQAVTIQWTFSKTTPKIEIDSSKPFSPTDREVSLALRRVGEYLRMKDRQKEPDWVPLQGTSFNCKRCSHYAECASFESIEKAIEPWKENGNDSEKENA